MIEIIFIGIVVSFLVTFAVSPFFIKWFKKIGMCVPDVHKTHRPLTPRGAGVPVITGFSISIILIVIYLGFVDMNSISIPILFGLLILSFITFTGFLDDLTSIKDKSAYKSQEKKRLPQWVKPLLILPAIVPVMFMNLGVSEITLPFLGTYDFGIYYLLILAPIGIFGAANMVNLLEGLNGMSSGMGIIYTFMLGMYAFVNGRYEAAIFAFALFGALLAIWFFHKTPAKILAGDSLTYMLGGSIALIALIGNIEKAALIVSIPFMIELALKMRGKLKKETIGYAFARGKVKSKYKRIYSIPHIWMRSGKYTEKQIVYILILIEFLCSLLIWIV